VITFGTAITDPAVYERVALPGIERVAEEDSLILNRTGYDSIQRAYNEMMDEAADLPGLEALILLHQDLELVDPDHLRRTRRVFCDPHAGLFGALGGRVSKFHCWLAPDEIFGFALGPEHMGAEIHISTGPHEVDGVDGALLILAPWVVRSIRFGEAPPGRFHGYDVDLSARVRAAGGRVICEDIVCRHRTTTKHDHEAQQAAGVALAKMWDPTLRPREWGPAFQH
jgi:Glycosyltransferase like family